MDWIVTIYCTLICGIWYVSYLISIRAALSIPLFENAHPREPETWPGLSVVIAACNEADTIERAITTLVRQDYPDLEIILINDRSDDGTGEIISHISEKNDRFRAVHIRTLPPGWLGKVHAFHVGVQKASREWILFTDADVHFRQGTLRRSVAFAMAGQFDHLTLGPVPKNPSFWLKVVVHTFGMMFVRAVRVEEVA